MTMHVVWVAVGAIVGAAMGAKLSFWLDDPLTAFADFPSLRHVLEGKSIIGALLGGLPGVELGLLMLLLLVAACFGLMSGINH